MGEGAYITAGKRSSRNSPGKIGLTHKLSRNTRAERVNISNVI